MPPRRPPDPALQLAGAQRLAEAVGRVPGVRVVVGPGSEMPLITVYLDGADPDVVHEALAAAWGGDWPYGPVKVSIEPGEPGN